jgi:hypothetical protein
VSEVTHSASFSRNLWFHVSKNVLLKATQLANARLTESERRSSPDRPSARNLHSQIRGAVGELIASEWLRANSFKVDDGYMDDHMHNSDLVVNGVSIEVMTAKIQDRRITGFCIPPNKLNAAQRRQAWGYLFIGTDEESPPKRVLIQGVTSIDKVDSREAQETYVNNPQFAVLNFVVEPNNVRPPNELLTYLKSIQSRK